MRQRSRSNRDRVNTEYFRGDVVYKAMHVPVYRPRHQTSRDRLSGSDHPIQSIENTGNFPATRRAGIRHGPARCGNSSASHSAAPAPRTKNLPTQPFPRTSIRARYIWKSEKSSVLKRASYPAAPKLAHYDQVHRTDMNIQLEVEKRQWKTAILALTAATGRADHEVFIYGRWIMKASRLEREPPREIRSGLAGEQNTERKTSVRRSFTHRYHAYRENFYN